MHLTDALSLGDSETVVFVGGAAKVDLLFALAREISTRGTRVVSTSTVRFPVPRPDQSEACVADAETEVAYRDTIERLKYFPYVHTGIGGTGGFVTTRTTNIGRNYRPSPANLIHALAQNGSMPYLLIFGDEIPKEPGDMSGKTRSIPEQATIVVAVASIEGPRDENAVLEWLSSDDGPFAWTPAGARTKPVLVPASPGAIDDAKAIAGRLRDAGVGGDRWDGVVIATLDSDSSSEPGWSAITSS